EKLIFGALPRLAEPPVAELGALLANSGRPAADRIRAARGLAVLERADARAELLRAVGGDPQALRTVGRELAGAIPPPIAKAVLAAYAGTPQGQGQRRADLLLILGMSAAREPEVRDAALEALKAASAPPQVFEVRARAIGA